MSAAVVTAFPNTNHRAASTDGFDLDSKRSRQLQHRASIAMSAWPSERTDAGVGRKQRLSVVSHVQGEFSPPSAVVWRGEERDAAATSPESIPIGYAPASEWGAYRLRGDVSASRFNERHARAHIYAHRRSHVHTRTRIGGRVTAVGQAYQYHCPGV